MLLRVPHAEVLLALLGLLEASSVAEQASFPNDMQTFVSRPDIEAPLMTVKTYDERHISTGLWFLPIFDNAGRPEIWVNETRNVGPYIYDTYGVRTAFIFYKPRRSAFDFKPCTVNGTEQLSMILGMVSPQTLRETPVLGSRGTNTTFPDGANLFLDASYRVSSEVPLAESSQTFNIHEFKVFEGGKKTLRIMVDKRYWSGIDPRTGTHKGGILVGNGFQTLNTETGEVLFEWNSLDHVLPWTSYRDAPKGWGDDPESDITWDYFHMNSVDIDDNRDYLISSRYMWVIYKISGDTGNIVWSLGGSNSTFALLPEGEFKFSHQHDARFRGRSEDGGIYYISFLNNAADERSSTANHSIALSVALDVKSMTATMVGHWDRPDGELSRSKGNMQILSNSNVFVGWGENGYLSEFSESGELIQEARFLSDRFVTYRIYKYDFTSTPSIDELAIKSFWHEAMEGGVMEMYTRLYMSWNGATEVARWRVYSSQQGNFGDDNQWIYVNTIPKDGFETMFEHRGDLGFVRVQAMDTNGRFLGMSSPYLTVPSSWSCASENCTQSWFEAGGIASEERPDETGQTHDQWWKIAVGTHILSISWLALVVGSVVFLIFLLSMVLATIFGILLFYRTQRQTGRHGIRYGIVSGDAPDEKE